MQTLKILGFSGSLRKESYNTKLLKMGLDFAAELRPSEYSLKSEFISLHDLALPLFNEDHEENEAKLPPVLKWKEALKKADAFLIASPEYNGSLSGALKNAIDWASRQAPGERILECFENKVVLLASASPGVLGGNRALPHLRAICAQLRCHVYYEQFALARANEALLDEKQIQNWKSMIGRFANFTYAVRRSNNT